MAISQNFPEEGPTLNLNFAGSKVLDPRITFSRSSVGTYMDANGLVATASTDSPRFDHRYVNGEIESLGLLVEEQRTNLLPHTEDFSSGWSHIGFTSNAVDSTYANPTGSLGTKKLIEDGPSNQKVLYRYHNVDDAGGNNQIFSHSCFVKPIGNRHAQLSIHNAGSPARAISVNFDLNNIDTPFSTSISSFASSVDYGVIPYPNGWYKLYLIGNTSSQDSDGTTLAFHVRILNASGSSNYTGDGSSGLYVYGAQLEAGEFPTSYIPTSGSTVTRSSDSVSMTGTNFSDWYNQSEGSILWRGTIHSAPISGSRIFEIYNSSTDTERMAISVENSGEMYMRVRKTNDTATQTYGLGTVSYGSEYKISLGVDGSSLCLAVNDEIKTTISDSFTLSSSDTLILTDLRDLGGARKFTTRHLNLSYYPTRLSNTVLQTLTK